MDLHQCLQAMGVEDPEGVVAPHWEESMATLPGDTPDFLRPENVREWREYCRMDPAVDETLVEVAATIDRTPHLKAFAWHAYRRLYVHTGSDGFNVWPSLTRDLPEAPDALYLLLCLAAVPLTVDKHRELGVDPEVTRDTMLEIKC
ncbi:MAG: hypothetical protein GF320_15195, partial [Armatimonadia bacterium]|nr:hypothetical protein [Armatimonadia bacterium]